MGKLTINMAGSLDPLPEGEYRAEVEDVVLRDTQDRESQYLRVRLRVCEGEHTDDVVWMIPTLKQQHERWLAQTLTALGIKTEGEVEFEFSDKETPRSRKAKQKRPPPAPPRSIRARRSPRRLRG